MTKIEHLDDKFDFGKFYGCTFAEVLEYSPSYITWVLENVDGSNCVFSDSIIDEIRLIFPEYEITESFELLRKQRLAECRRGYKRCEEQCCNLEYEPQTYGKYSGTYAQDEMGYSDDDIDTIFDGDPSAYWNID